ncbi:hypothetical protein J6590_030123 [Homalodisca vitripennis]|nr:hypothetical protein J6590_030123 [Homalodisca vitripennis]
MTWLPCQLANNLLGRSSAGWRPDRALLRSWGGSTEATARGDCRCFWGRSDIDSVALDCRPVQEAKRGSLTPKTEKSRVEEELAFFNRSSRTPRSPPQTSEVSGRKAELGTVSLMAQTISPPPATFKFTGSNPEDQFTALKNPSHPEDVETELLKGMSDLVESMLQTLKVQRNVNSGLKEGLPKLKDQLQQMMDLVLRRLNQRAGTSEKKLPGRKRARRASCPSPEEKSPSDQRPTISTMERATRSLQED